MTRLEDVAREAKVSKMTVSRVLSGRNNVTDNTRNRVLDAVKKLGYRKNYIASGLATKKTSTIGVLLTNINNQIYSAVISGICDSAYKYGYSVMISLADTYQRAVKAIDNLLSKQVDGIFILPVEFSNKSANTNKLINTDCDQENIDKFYAWLNQQILRDQALAEKIIMVGNVTGQMDISNISTVGTDIELAAQYAIAYLLDNNHTEIGMIFHENQKGIWSTRKSTIERYYQGKSLRFLEKNVVYSNESNSSVKKAVKRLLKNNNSITAILCSNDFMAVGAIFACHELGLRVPEDMSIIGNDGIDYDEMVSPALTTVSIESYNTGIEAMRAFLEKEKNACLIKKLIKPRLIVRQSVRKI